MDPAKLCLGVDLFNAGSFFDAHEVLEDIWRETRGPHKDFLQAVIQAAVGLHHYSTGNLAGARSLLARAGRKLAKYPESYRGLEVGELRCFLRDWSVADGPPPPLPHLGTDATIAALVKQAAAKVVPVREVPQLDLRRQHARIRDEIAQAIARVCHSQQFIFGEEVAAFEREAAEFLGVSFVVGCASGTDALWLALVAAAVQPSHSVITTPFSFFSSVEAIVRADARPVLVDVDPRTLNLDPVQVEQRIRNSRPVALRAILPVHLYGQCADMDALARLASEHKLAVIEDAAQAFGASWAGRRAGGLGTAAAFSFYPTKNLSAYGDGGCVSTNDEALAVRVRLLGNLGGRERYFHDEIGANSRLDALQAAVLRVKLKHLRTWNIERRQRANEYTRLLTDAGLVSKGSTVPAPLALLHTAPDAHHIFHQYMIRAARRDQLREFLSARRIGTQIYYPLPLHQQKCFRHLGYGEGDFPEAERAAREVLALPMFPELTAEEQRYVVESIAEFYS